MKTIVIKPKNKAEETFLTQLLKKMNVEAHLVDERVPNPATQQAIKDVESGKGTHVKNSKKLFEELGI
jgi:transcriptional antiterminator